MSLKLKAQANPSSMQAELKWETGTHAYFYVVLLVFSIFQNDIFTSIIQCLESDMACGLKKFDWNVP